MLTPEERETLAVTADVTSVKWAQAASDLRAGKNILTVARDVVDTQDDYTTLIRAFIDEMMD